MRKIVGILLAFLSWSCDGAGESSCVAVNLVLAQPKAAYSSWYVQVALEGADLERPVTASARGIASQTQARLELETVSGGPRRLSAVLFLFDAETVDVWSGSLPDVYLVPGDQTVELQLVHQPNFFLEGEIVVESADPVRVWVEDLSTRVAFPAVFAAPSEPGRQSFTLQLPQGRFLRLVAQGPAGEKRTFDECLLRAVSDATIAFEGDFATGACVRH